MADDRTEARLAALEAAVELAIEKLIKLGDSMVIPFASLNIWSFSTRLLEAAVEGLEKARETGEEEETHAEH